MFIIRLYFILSYFISSIRSDHQCVIVTGDNAFTSISVAKEVGIVKNEKNLIIFNPDNKKWERNYDEEKDEDVD